ncbi:hypothetical protein [Treponema zioleckii]|uniref:hypothetical protein n=1 Tax=Treponema zioleckii TaxID=331680 RepID=UPI00168B683D|nr:hypothetical protein [Treponema zioleckii]
MKRIISFLISFTLILAGISAEKWKNKIGLGFTLPLSSLEFDEENTDSVFTKGFGANGFFLGVKDNGFSLKAGFSLGVSSSDDININGKLIDTGFFYDVAFGAGYTFVKTENLTVSLLGMLGFDVTIFNSTDNDVIEDSKKLQKKSKLSIRWGRLMSVWIYSFLIKCSLILVFIQILVCDTFRKEAVRLRKNGLLTKTDTRKPILAKLRLLT